MLSNCLSYRKNSENKNPKGVRTKNRKITFLSKSKDLVDYQVAWKTPCSKIRLVGLLLFYEYEMNVYYLYTSFYQPDINICLKCLQESQDLHTVLVNHLQ